MKSPATPSVVPLYKKGPLYTESRYKDCKDPCIVFDGTTWHLYGSGGTIKTETWEILHATSPTIEGPWQEIETVKMVGLSGDHVAAPSVVYDAENKKFHMCIQTEFLALGGTIEYLDSPDGKVFTKVKTILESIPDSSEAGIYDPHQSEINSEKYLVYAGTPAVEGFHNQIIIEPDIYVAKSETNMWHGPWKRIKKILDHTDIEWHHNPRKHETYEWGIEGPQLIQLPSGNVLLNATCFLHEGRYGTRQRVFFAVGKSAEGPFTSLGPVLVDLSEEWESGENGHATGVVQDDRLYLFYQARKDNWRYGLAVFDIAAIEKAIC